MIDAYISGRDLYAVIAQSAFDNKYEENLEFWPEGTELTIDGEKVIAGNKTHKNPEGKSRRSVGKTCLLAACYGMSGATAGARLGKTKEEGQKLLDSFFKGFPQVKKAIDDSKAFLHEKHYVEDWAGRRRHLEDYFLTPYEVNWLKDPSKDPVNFNPILGCDNRAVNTYKLTEWEEKVNLQIEKSQVFQREKFEKEKAARLLAAKTPEEKAEISASEYINNGEMSNKAFEKLAKEALADGILLTANTGRRAQAERQCFNARIQGGAASLTKLAMVNITKDKVLKDCNANLIITVHDEVLVETPAYYADKVEQRLPQVMVDTAKPYINVPMKCDPACESRWYASEAAAEIQTNYTKLEGKLGKDAATKQIIAEHPELPEQSILDVITGAEELVF